MIGVLLACLAAAPLPPPPDADPTEALLRSMTREEKVGQLMMIGFSGTELTPHIRHWLTDKHAGAVALFSRNIVHFEQTARFTRALKDAARLPIFVALDQEGGNVVRVKEGALLLPSNMALGATRSASLALVAGQSLGIDLAALGFNMNLAPVLDVNSNPKNPVIGIRSYGERPELVGRLGSWYVRGLQEMGIVAVAKHFPGHGDTHSDSHFAMPSVDASYDRLKHFELFPFRKAMEAGLDAVMTAHIALPKVDPSRGLPATLSPYILTKILREDLHFDGIVITDGLEMRGIVERYGSGAAAVAAIRAGADMPMILWTPEVKDEVFDAILAAVDKGEISLARLEQSVRRILKVKWRHGLFEQGPLLEDVLRHGPKNTLHDRVAERIARDAVTLVRNHGSVLPIHPLRYRRVLVLTPPGPLGETLRAQPGIEVMTVPYVPDKTKRKNIVRQAVHKLRNADLLVVAASNSYHLGLAQSITKRVRSVPFAVVSLGSPYYLSSIPDADAYVCTYSHLDAAQRAAADALLGRQPMPGRLPISIPGHYAYGHALRLSDTSPPAQLSQASLELVAPLD